eukprot:11968033-Karenia_brevis.AAC.1
MGTKTLDVEKDEFRAGRLTEVSGITESQKDFPTTSRDESGLVKIKILGYKLEIGMRPVKRGLEDNATFTSAIETLCKDTFLQD